MFLKQLLFALPSAVAFGAAGGSSNAANQALVDKVDAWLSAFADKDTTTALSLTAPKVTIMRNLEPVNQNDLDLANAEDLIKFAHPHTDTFLAGNAENNYVLGTFRQETNQPGTTLAEAVRFQFCGDLICEFHILDGKHPATADAVPYGERPTPSNMDLIPIANAILDNMTPATLNADFVSNAVVDGMPFFLNYQPAPIDLSDPAVVTSIAHGHVDRMFAQNGNNLISYLKQEEAGIPEFVRWVFNDEGKVESLHVIQNPDFGKDAAAI